MPGTDMLQWMVPGCAQAVCSGSASRWITRRRGTSRSRESTAGSADTIPCSIPSRIWLNKSRKCEGWRAPGKLCIGGMDSGGINMQIREVLELLIGLVVVLSAPALVWSAVIVGLVKVGRRRAAARRPTPSGSTEL
jgi:hypothetical protein